MTKWMAVVAGAVVSLGVLVPAVAYAIGREDGPCDVVINCGDGSTLACHGELECTYRGGRGGFVSCDGATYFCE